MTAQNTMTPEQIKAEAERKERHRQMDNAPLAPPTSRQPVEKVRGFTI